ncbi:fasciclin domain-containing protein [Dokdonia donghaensis]|uniref:Beta-Ig-H3/fasciclin n=1 Tax=Dokdonia donghaensis DSW-1 TaxID=1300343 RepID=A0A0A2GU69_9FLAO|nr:fasciclin domain-containing protein [Dokdonia donghaensis]ANH60917.1 Immunogenic protein MPT70 precursor [Dokdonia donghaensis DSW-1]KGO05836.1 beta-Ig-H3/fasciclin [Dokdonia donghaensis DSW-1]
MKKMLLMAATAGLLFASCAEGTKEKATETNEEVAQAVVELEEPVVEEPGTIVDIAVGNENFTTLVTAVKAAGLVETLSSTGPFTVFAPTNDAFAKLPEGTVGTLVKPENKAMLTDILTYHVVSGEYMAGDVVAAIKKNNGSFSTNTVMGEQITLMMDGENVVIKDAKGGTSVIIMTDVDASNGVIHAIDTVIMPKGK